MHFLIGDLDALSHAALAHTADDHLAANLVTGIGVREAICRQGGAELLDAHTITLGDGANGLVQLFIRDANARAFANL